MTKFARAALPCLVALMIPMAGLAQDGSGETARPAPRLPDGTVNLGPAPGETGHWDTGRGGALMENEVELESWFLVDPSDVGQVAPFKPWARELFLARQANLGLHDPHPRCSGNGGPRTFDTPYGIDFVQDTTRQRILILVGWSRRWREIHMDGRPHPDLETYTPTFFGHSVGRWEDDALVIDTHNDTIVGHTRLQHAALRSHRGRSGGLYAALDGELGSPVDGDRDRRVPV